MESTATKPVSLHTKLSSLHCNLVTSTEVTRGLGNIPNPETCTAQGWYLWLFLPFSKMESLDFPGQSLDFLPERWLDGQGELIKEPRLFIPFSEGPRNCVGWRLAMDESKVGGAGFGVHACMMWLLQDALSAQCV